MFWEVEIPHGELEGVDDQQVEEGDDDHPAENEEKDASEEAEHLEVYDLCDIGNCPTTCEMCKYSCV